MAIAAAKLNQIKKTLQDHLRSGIVIIVGSGLSCAEGLPGMGDLVKHLEAVVPRTTHLKFDIGEWNKIISAIKSLGLESALKSISVSDEISNFIRTETARCIKELEQVVIKEVMFDNRILKFSELLVHLPQDNRFAVITTNYDRLIELAAEKSGFLVDTRSRGNHFAPFSKTEGAYAFVKNVIRLKNGLRKIEEKVISLYKPHGSLDWADQNGIAIRSAFDLGPEHALIITPGVEKYRAGYNMPFDLHRELANEAIDRADKLLIIGYGFNDDHLETHLKRKIKSGTQTVMMAYKLTDSAKSYLNDCPISVWGLESAYPEDGTLIHNNKITYHLKNENLWDTSGFVKGVLKV